MLTIVFKLVWGRRKIDLEASCSCLRAENREMGMCWDKPLGKDLAFPGWEILVRTAPGRVELFRAGVKNMVECLAGIDPDSTRHQAYFYFPNPNAPVFNWDSIKARDFSQDQACLRFASQLVGHCTTPALITIEFGFPNLRRSAREFGSVPDNHEEPL